MFCSENLRRGLVLLSLLTVACGGDDDEAKPVQPDGPPSIAITALRSAGGPEWSPADSGDGCVELGRDPDETIMVVVALRNWTLRPPFACGGLLQCGHLKVTVPTGTARDTLVAFPEASADAGAGTPLPAEASVPMDGGPGEFVMFRASTTMGIPFARIQPREGPHTIRVELNFLAESYRPVEGGADQEADEVEITVQRRCGQPFVDAGSDAAFDAAGDVSIAADGAVDGAGVDAAALDASSDAPSDASADGASVDASSEASPPDSAADADATSASDASADAPAG